MLDKTAYAAIETIIENHFSQEAEQINTKIDRAERILNAEESCTDPDCLIREAFEMLHQEAELRLAGLDQRKYNAILWLEDGPFLK